MTARSRRPVHGYPTVVLLPRLERTLWWGEDSDGVAVVATLSSRVASWPTPEDCRADAAARGWADAMPDEPPVTMDLRPAATWLTGHRTAMDHAALLDAWNLAGDVALSVGAAWDDRGRLADACHSKLTHASVPWLAGGESDAPRWSVPELRYLRRRVGAATTLLRRQLTPGRRHA